MLTLIFVQPRPNAPAGDPSLLNFLSSGCYTVIMKVKRILFFYDYFVLVAQVTRAAVNHSRIEQLLDNLSGEVESVIGWPEVPERTPFTLKK